MRYEVVVATTMRCSVWVEASCADEAEEIVENNVHTVDYCNETCGFDFDDIDNITEITNTDTDCIDIVSIYGAEE